MAHSPGFLRRVEEAKKQITECTVQEVLARSDRFYLVDVREESEWAKGHARGAIHIGKGVIERDVEGLIPDKNAPVVLYCGGGFRSALAAESIQKMGYTNVLSMDGGFRVWQSSGAPIES
jgi:rhodanese-related sulfurtransferase